MSEPADPAVPEMTDGPGLSKYAVAVQVGPSAIPISTDVGLSNIQTITEAGQPTSQVAIDAGPPAAHAVVDAEPAFAKTYGDDIVLEQAPDYKTASTDRDPGADLQTYPESQTYPEFQLHPEPQPQLETLDPLTMPVLSMDQEIIVDFGGNGRQFVLPPAGWAFGDTRRHPFEDTTQRFGPSIGGVMKFSNIPFTVTFAEIQSLLPRGVRILTPHEQGYPIHITIDRTSGRTGDCFVEFQTVEAAAACVSGLMDKIHRGLRIKVGSRSVFIGISSQKELMGALFPRAKRVVWNDMGVPTILERGAGDFSGPFRGFLTLEEVNCLAIFAQAPNRSPFTDRNPARIYQSMISTLYKFPWMSHGSYWISSRNELFEAYIKQLAVLVQKVSLPQQVRAIKHLDPAISPQAQHRRLSSAGEVGLDHKLLFDHLFAGMNCLGFNPQQKATIVETAGSYGKGLNLPCPKLSPIWPFDCLSFRHGIDEQELPHFLNLINVGFVSLTESGAQFKHGNYCWLTRSPQNGLLYMEWTERGRMIPFKNGVKYEYEIAMSCISRGWNIFIGEVRMRFPQLAGTGDDEEDDAFQAKHQPQRAVERGPLRFQVGQEPFPAIMPADYDDNRVEYGSPSGHIHQPSPLRGQYQSRALVSRHTSIHAIAEEPRAESAAEREHNPPEGKGKGRAVSPAPLGNFESIQAQLRNITNTMQSQGTRLNAESRPFTPGIPWTEEHGTDPGQFKPPGQYASARDDRRGLGGDEKLPIGQGRGAGF